MNIRFSFAIFFCLSKLCFSMNQDDLRKTIDSDSIELLDDALSKGLNINTRVENTPMLLRALSRSAEKIAQLLIRKKANVNLRCENAHAHTVTALFLAIYNKKISIETIKLLLEHGANINEVFIYTATTLFKSEIVSHSLFDTLLYTDVTKEKRQFIINYLINHYADQVLIEALSKNQHLLVIKRLVANGAFIPKNIVEIARKLNVKKEIIRFFKRQTKIRKAIGLNIPSLPNDVADLIYGYSQGPEQEIDCLLIEAVNNKDIHFIKDYIKMGGKPNYIIKLKNGKWSLFLYALVKEAEEIANFLMEHGANINLQGKEKTIIYSPILVAFEHGNISISFIEKMLNNNAKIYNVGATKGTFKNNYVNLSVVLSNEKVSDEKRIFLFNYLLRRFGLFVLDYILEEKTTLNIVQKFVSKGVIVNKNMIEKAKKSENPEEVIKFLQEVLQMNEYVYSFDSASKKCVIS